MLGLAFRLMRKRTIAILHCIQAIYRAVRLLLSPIYNSNVITEEKNGIIQSVDVEMK